MILSKFFIYSWLINFIWIGCNSVRENLAQKKSIAPYFYNKPMFNINDHFFNQNNVTIRNEKAYFNTSKIFLNNKNGIA